MVRLGRTLAEPPICAATRKARVPVVAAPERVICVAAARSGGLALMRLVGVLSGFGVLLVSGTAAGGCWSVLRSLVPCRQSSSDFRITACGWVRAHARDAVPAVTAGQIVPISVRVARTQRGGRAGGIPCGIPPALSGQWPARAGTKVAALGVPRPVTGSQPVVAG